jgi:DNA-binding transcriptional LysR family regulator
MSSVDPIEVASPNLASGDTLRRGHSSEKRPTNTSDPVLREDNDVRSEKPQANPEANPESRKTDRKLPETDQTEEQGPKGVKGAFRKDPIAMVACLGLIVVGVIAGIAVTGQGIALGRMSVTRSDILAGKLVRLSAHSLRVSYCHYAVYPMSSESNPALVAFRDWLIEEARRT